MVRGAAAASIGSGRPMRWWDRLLVLPLVIGLASAAVGPVVQHAPLAPRLTLVLAGTALAALALVSLLPRHWLPLRVVCPALALAAGCAIYTLSAADVAAADVALPLLATLAPDPSVGVALLLVATGALARRGDISAQALPWLLVSWAVLAALAALKQVTQERGAAITALRQFASALESGSDAADGEVLRTVRRLTSADQVALLRGDARPQGVAAVAQPFLWLHGNDLRQAVAHVAPAATQYPAGFPIKGASTIELAQTPGSKLFVVGGNRDRDELLIELARLLDLRESNRRLQALAHEADYHALESLVKALDARDPYTRGHSERVARYAEAIGREIGLPEDVLKELWRGGMLHDVGKIGIPERILNKPDKLTADEFDVMKGHVKIGVEIIDAINSSANVLDIVSCHHENHNGSGYPRRLSGSQIPLLGRIAHVADSFEAMTSARSYNRPRNLTDGLAELRRCAGSAFDPTIVDAFAVVLRREGEALMRSHEHVLRGGWN